MNPWLQSIEKAARHVVVYPVLRLVLNNHQVSLPLELSTVRRLLFLRYDRLGDVVVTSSLVRRLRSMVPGVFIGMVTSRTNQPAAELLEGVDRYHVIGGSPFETWKAIRDARSIGYDLVLNLVFNRTTSGGLLANIIAPGGIKVGQGAEKYRFYFNALATLARGQHHMSEILRSLGTQVFGDRFADDDLRYSLTDDPKAAQRVEAFLKGLNGAPVLLNISAGDAVRTPSVEQVQAIARHISQRMETPIVVIASPGQEAWREAVVRACRSEQVHEFPQGGPSSFAEVVALTRRCRLVVTPDTSLVHIAGATGTPLLALYTTAFTMKEWGPRHTIAEVILGSEGCPLSELPVPSILEAFDRLIAKVRL